MCAGEGHGTATDAGAHGIAASRSTNPAATVFPPMPGYFLKPRLGPILWLQSPVLDFRTADILAVKKLTLCVPAPPFRLDGRGHRR